MLECRRGKPGGLCAEKLFCHGDGGYPEKGQLFFEREEGREMIGTLPSYARGGIVNSNTTFGDFRPSGTMDEVIIKADYTPNKNTIDAIHKAILDSLNKH